MTSRNRITVNLPTNELRRHIEKLALSRGLTCSGLIRDLISASLSDNAEAAQFMDEIRGGKNVINNNSEEDITRILRNTRKQQGAEQQLVLNARELPLADYNFILSFNEVTQFEQQHKLMGKSGNALNELVKTKLKAHIAEKVPAIVGRSGGVPDILHLFVKNAKIRYVMNDNGFWEFRSRIVLHLQPLFIDDAKKSRLDFFNIKFKQFRHVAVNGWDKKKYEQLVFIEQASSSRSGGYFVGLSPYDVDYTMAEYKDFTPAQITYGAEPYSLNFMIHIHHRDMKIKKQKSFLFL
ncbi:hypothetical protein [Serratia sp. CY74737]|uniref:hypothetical protein n=1 Tax=Serratia sp. CY74737 TaxID=3383677 RepID=UPI003F9F46B3